MILDKPVHKPAATVTIDSRGRAQATSGRRPLSKKLPASRRARCRLKSVDQQRGKLKCPVF